MSEDQSLDILHNHAADMTDVEIKRSNEKSTQTEGIQESSSSVTGLTGGKASQCFVAGAVTGHNVNITVNGNNAAKPDDEESDNIESLIQRKKSLFIKSKSFRTVKTTLEENRFVVITGAPKEGKTTLAVQLCDSYMRFKQYKGSYYGNPAMVRFCDEDKSIIIIDNMFEDADFQQTGDEADILDLIEKQIAKSSEEKILFIIVSQLFDVRRAGRLLQSKLLKGDFVVDISKINCSHREERIHERVSVLNHLSVCLTHLEQNQIANHTPNFISFAGICAFYDTNKQNMSFDKCVYYPHKYFFDQIRHITKRDRIKAGLLMFLLFCRGLVNMSDLSKSEMQKKLRIVFKVFGEIPMENLQNEAHCLIGTYLRYVKDGANIVEFCDRVLYDACIAVFCEDFPECISQNCKLMFLDGDNIDSDNIDRDNNELQEDDPKTISDQELKMLKELKDIILSITKSNGSVIMEDVIELVKSRRFADALKNPVLQSPECTHSLFQQLEKDHPYLIQSKDVVNGGSFLFCSAASGNHQLTSSVLNHPTVKTADVNETIANCVDMESMSALENIQKSVTKCERMDIKFDVNCRDEAGRTPLMHAAMDNRTKVVHELLQKGADPSLIDNKGQNCVHLAVARDNVEVFQALKKEVTKDVIEAKDCNDFSPKMVAYKKKGKVYENLRSHTDGVQSNEVNNAEASVVPPTISESWDSEDILLKIMSNDVDDVDSLLSKGLNVNFKFANGDTVVMKAAYYGCDKVFEHLVSNKSSLSGENDHKCNILHAACIGGNINIVKNILSKDIVDINSKNGRGRTPVMEATEQGHGTVFDFLVKRGCDLSVQDFEESTILHLACAGGCIDIVEYVLSQTSVDVNSKDQRGRLAEDFARNWHWDIQIMDKLKGDKDGDTCVVEVTGLPSNATKDSLSNYFENKRRSGGGNVKKVEINRNGNVALVYFEKAEVAQRVLKQGSHIINKTHIEVSAHVEGLPQAAAAANLETSDCESPSRTIEVRGFKPGTSVDTFENYFENTRRSGGGEVRRLERQNSAIHVTFATAEDANRVVGKRQEVDGKILKVKLHIPKPYYRNRLLVTNLPSTSTTYNLRNFLEARSKCEVTDIVYGEEPGKALVTFHEETIPDVDKLKQVCKVKPFQESKIEISTAPIADSIVVEGLGPNTSDETVSYYFESKRSGSIDGSGVLVTMNTEERICIVMFESYKVADAVLSKDDHKLEGAVLSLSIYHECLGMSRTEDDAFLYQQLEAFTLENLNERKCMYIQQDKDVELKKKLAVIHAEITWLSHKSASLKCTLTEMTPYTVKTAKTWKKETEKCFNAFLDQITIEEVTSLSEIWEDILSKLKSMKVPTNGVALFISDTNPLIEIVGSSSSVSPVAKDIKAVVSAAEEDFNKKQQQVTETVTSLKPIQLNLLLALGFHEEMMRNHKDLSVVIQMKQKEITYKGQANDITICKLKMFETTTSFCSKTDDGFSKAQLYFLNQEDVKDKVVNRMKAENMFGVWEAAAECGGLFILSTSDDDVLSIAGIIRVVIIEHTETLSPETLFLLSTEKWAHLLQDIQSLHGHFAKISTSLESKTITIVTTHDLEHEIRLKIREFIEENSVCSKVVKLSKPIHRFLIMHREFEIDRIADAISKYNCEIDFSNAAHQVTIRGCEEGMAIAIEQLMNMTQNVMIRQYTMRRSGIEEYIHSDTIKVAIADTEKSEQCVIEHECDETEKLEVDRGCLEQISSSSMPTVSTVTGITQIASCVVGQGRQIDVVFGDMTTMEVDVIVNAAHNRMEHISGLARHIATVGGPSIQRESDEYIRNHKNVQVGDAVPTGAGHLPCKMVVHAVGPVWSNGRHNDEQDLKDAVMTSMKWADRKGFKSIVLPALSAEIFGYPIELATKHIVEAIKTFFELESPNCGLTNVYLVDVNQITVNHFVTALQEVYTDMKLNPAAESINTFKPTDDVKPKQPGSIAVTVVKGDIAQQKATVIVNSTSSNLDLSSGAVSKSLLMTGGASLQSELNQKYPHGIQPGDIAVSGGGNLHCQKVYHICLPNLDGVQGNPSDFLKRLVKSCLEMASNHGCASIAFPALGAGYLGYPKKVVAKTMYTSVKDFEQRNKSLDRVFFVVDHSETFKAFDRYQHQVESGESFDNPATSRHSWKYQAEEDEENEGMVYTSPPNSFKIDLVKGEINTQVAAVIVNSVNNNLDLNNGAVSKSLLKTGGNTLQKELAAKYPHGITPGDIAATSGGKLQCKEVYHACLASWADHSSQKVLLNLVLKCLQKASTAGYKSVAFPALGTGNLGYPTDIVARTMYSALNKFQQRNDSLEEVKIVIYPKDTPVIKVFEKCEIQRKSKDYSGDGKSTKSHQSFDRGAHIGSVSQGSAVLYFFSDDAKYIDNGIRKLEKIWDDELMSKEQKDTTITKRTDEQVKT